MDLHGAILVNVPGTVLMATMREAVASRSPLVLCTSSHPAGSCARPAMPGEAPMRRSQRHTYGAGKSFSAKLTWRNDQAALAVRGELDLTGVAHLHDAVREIAARPARAVKLDLSRLTFADVAGVRALAAAERELQQAAGPASFTGIQPLVRRTAGLLGVTLTACLAGRHQSPRAVTVRPDRR